VVQEVKVKPITSSVQTDTYGNVQYVTNSYVEISQSVEIQTVISKVYKTKPQLSTLRPISTKTVTYGDIIETVVVFGGSNKPGVQVVSLYNKVTQEVTVIDSKVLIANIKTLNAEILPVTEVQTIPIVALPVAIRKFPELKVLVSTVERTGKLSVLTV